MAKNGSVKIGNTEMYYALDQIDELRYDAEMKEDGIADILKFGIAFSGKKVSVKTK